MDIDDYEGWQCCACDTFHETAVVFLWCKNKIDGTECGHRREHPDGGHCRPAAFRWNCCECGSDHNQSEHTCYKEVGGGQICAHSKVHLDSHSPSCELELDETYEEFWLCCKPGCLYTNDPNVEICQSNDEKGGICGQERVHKSSGKVVGECRRVVHMWLCPQCGNPNNMLVPKCTGTNKHKACICEYARDEDEEGIPHFVVWSCGNTECKKLEESKKTWCTGSFDNIAICPVCGLSRKYGRKHYLPWKEQQPSALCPPTSEESSEESSDESASPTTSRTSIEYASPSESNNSEQQSRNTMPKNPSNSKSRSSKSSDHKPSRSSHEHRHKHEHQKKHRHKSDHRDNHKSKVKGKDKGEDEDKHKHKHKAKRGPTMTEWFACRRRI